LLIDGIHIPLTTPFHRDGALYLRKLEYNVGRYSLTPAAGFVALTGEGASLSDEETRDALQAVGATAAPEKVLVAAISKGSVRAALAVAQQASDAHFDAIFLSAPPDWPSLTQPELKLFFQAVADASPLPVLLYSDPSDPFAPDFGLPVAMLAELSQHPNIAGLYDAGLTTHRYSEIAEATRDVQRSVSVTTIFAPVTRRMLSAAQASTVVTASALAGGTAVLAAPTTSGLKTRTKTVGFQIMAAGAFAGLVDLLTAGVAGALPRLAASAPQACYEAYAAFKDGDPALATEKEQRLSEADALIDELGIAAVKHGCDLNGYFGGGVRLPRLGLDGATRADVERVLAMLKN
jgi:dihydrodipicolinate synthase/N-acetylneuraminate lyase